MRQRTKLLIVLLALFGALVTHPRHKGAAPAQSTTCSTTWPAMTVSSSSSSTWPVRRTTAASSPRSTLLQRVVDKVLELENSSQKSTALLTAARVYGNLSEEERAQELLTQALLSTKTLNSSWSKADGLGKIASVAVKHMDATFTQCLLEQTVSVAERMNNSGAHARALSDIARAYGELSRGTRAQALLAQATAVADTLDPTRHVVSKLSGLSPQN